LLHDIVLSPLFLLISDVIEQSIVLSDFVFYPVISNSCSIFDS
jgi:hypothetical protein